MESFKKSHHWWFYPSSGRWSSPSTFCIYNIFILLLQLSSPFCQLFSARSKYCYALLTSMMRASCSMTVAATPPRRSILFRPWPGHLTRFRTYRWDYFLLWLHFFWLDVATPLLHLLSVWLLHIFGQNLESWHPLKSPGLLLKVSRWRFMCSPLLSLYELCVACVRPKVGGVAHTQCWTCRLQFAGTRVLSPLMACQ